MWRSRWDSLRLFTSGRYDNLPGLPFPAAADAYPGKDDVADYLQAYAAQFRLPVRLNTAVTSLTRTDGVLRCEGGPGSDRGPPGGARHRPLPGAVHPPVAAQLARRRCTSSTAPTTGVPMHLPPGRVSVVGAVELGLPDRARALHDPHGRPGRGPTIADDSAAAAGPRRVVVGDGTAPGPSHRGVPPGSTPGQAGSDHRGRAKQLTRRHGSPAPAPCDKSRRAGGDLRRRLHRRVRRRASGRPASPTTTRGSTFPASPTSAGRLRQSRGVTPSPGLYTLGLTWQHTRGSALLGWVGNDAAYLAEQIAAISA